MSAQRNTRLLAPSAAQPRDGKRNICAISPESGPISAVRWPTPCLRAPGMVRSPMSLLRFRIYRILASQPLICADPAPSAGRGCFEGWSKSMATEQRRAGERVTFERGIPAHMMGIDGTWRRECHHGRRFGDGSEAHRRRLVEGCISRNSSCCCLPRVSPIAAASCPGSTATRSASISLNGRQEEKAASARLRARKPEAPGWSHNRHVGG